MMSSAAIDMYLQYWCMYIIRYTVKIVGNVFGKLSFLYRFLYTFFHILHYNGVSAVLRGGPAAQMLRVPTYECKDITGLIGEC